MQSELVSDLEQVLHRSPGNVVLVIGAGVSMGALVGTPVAHVSSWASLLRHGLERCRALGLRSPDEIAAQGEHLDTDDASRWILAAEAITDALGGAGGGEFRAWLAATVGQFADESRNNDVLLAIRELSHRGVIVATVNYDGILERVTELPPVTWRQRAKVEALLRGDIRGILHLHGYWEEPESVILGARSYDEVIADEHARTVLETLRMTKTLVFLGHGAGLQDPNWASFLRWSERVFPGSSYRHYRLVRNHEFAQVQAQHPIGQRIVALGYGESHTELGPFLSGLVSRAPAPPVLREAVNTDETCIILRINIGEKDHKFISKEEAVSLVDHPNPVCLSYDFGGTFDRKTITPRQWRAIARGLDCLVEHAKDAAKGPTHFVIAARAPLPVFAYLGACMFNYGKVSVANDFGDQGWKLYGPHFEVQGPGRDDFERRPPKVGEKPTGKLAVVLRSSSGHTSHPTSLAHMVTAEGEHLIGSYEIVNDKTTQRNFALTNAELRVVLDHFQAAMQWRSNEAPRANGMLFALGCPNWLAFHLTNSINPNVVGRMDFPNLVDPERGYVPALSWPMQDAPWVLFELRVMVMSAEPMDASHTRAGDLHAAIRAEFEQVPRMKDRVQIQDVPAARIGDLIRKLETFRPDILHIHMHGSSVDLGFLDHRGDQMKVPLENFVERLESSDFEPTVIVLTACESAGFAKSLCGLAECVVAMVGEAQIDDALEFTRAFYGALARGKDLARAIRQGKSSAARHSVEHFVVDDVAPGDIVLLPAQRGD